MDYTPEDVEQLAARLLDVYVQRRKLNRRFYKPPHTSERLFKQLAKLVFEKDIDGVHFVTWAYNFFSEATKCNDVFVNQIASPKTVQIYMDRAPTSKSDRESDLRLKLQLQNDVIDTELRLGRELSDILVDYTLAIGAVLRYVFASQSGIDDLAEKFREGAELEIRLNPLYREILGDKLPPE